VEHPERPARASLKVSEPSMSWGHVNVLHLGAELPLHDVCHPGFGLAANAARDHFRCALSHLFHDDQRCFGMAAFDVERFAMPP
jgi:hypothetical protein